MVSGSRATSFVIEALLRLEHWEGRVERLGGVCWDRRTGEALVSRQTKEFHYLDESEDPGEDGRDDGENKSGDHHAPGLGDGAPDGKSARDEPGNSGKESKGWVSCQQELGQVDEKCDCAAQYMPDPKPSSLVSSIRTGIALHLAQE